MTTRQTLELYHPQEHTIISAWLNRQPPEGCPDIGDLPYHSYESEPPGPVGLRLKDYGDEDEVPAIENAVARLALEHIETRLPQWAAVYADGRIETARKNRKGDEKPIRTIKLFPQLICEINWASTGPGVSWPEVYYVTFLPGYDVYVVTASQDSPDLHGYTDEAIAWFTRDKPFKKSIFRAIHNYWEDFTCFSQWDYFVFPGLINERQADRIAGTIAWEGE